MVLQSNTISENSAPRVANTALATCITYAALENNDRKKPKCQTIRAKSITLGFTFHS